MKVICLPAVLLLSLVTGCSTTAPAPPPPPTTVPAELFIAQAQSYLPESSGFLHFDARTSIANGGFDVEVTPDVYSIPVDLGEASSPSVTTNNTIGSFMSEMGVYGKLNVGTAFDVTPGAENLNIKYFAKYQFLGDTQDIAKKGNLSMSVIFALKSTNMTIDSKTYNYYLDLTRSGIEAGLAAGFRPTNKLLIYANAITSLANLEGTQNSALIFSNAIKGTDREETYVLGFQYNLRDSHAFGIDVSRTTYQLGQTRKSGTFWRGYYRYSFKR